jgi:NAD(P)-dependent dehydrogenase (short-subunit alcohol dehydrogenase family)
MTESDNIRDGNGDRNGERDSTPGRVALVTGGSRGLGRALVERLVGDGWLVVTDGRDAAVLATATAGLLPRDHVTAIAGDVAEPAHREQLARAVARSGRLDLLVNNAGALGPTPLRALADTSLQDLRHLLAVNLEAPLGLIQSVLPLLRRSAGRVINVSSDAAVQAYPGWGGYGSTKAALDQLSAVLAAEEPAVRVYAVDPGDMATDMHRAAAPDDDLSELPPPQDVVPRLLALITADLPSGRYTARQLAPGAPA